jgi:Uma2 family endonuclease
MVTAIISPTKLKIPVGAVLRFPATWQEYQQLAQQRGDKSIPRIKYRNGEVLLMSPMPAHGRDSSLLGLVFMTLLDHDEREYDAYTPVTMDLPEESGIEPDYCFYVENWAAVSGKKRINWQQDPPPDLAIEVDVTSYSDVNDYLPYKVPEIWLWKKQRLQIYQLQDEQYVLCDRSRFFPDLDLVSILETATQETNERNSSFAIRNLRQRLAANERE